jgi:hypothetical protein
MATPHYLQVPLTGRQRPNNDDIRGFWIIILTQTDAAQNIQYRGRFKKTSAGACGLYILHAQIAILSSQVLFW